MPVPIRQQVTVGAYVLKQALLGRKRYPLVLMLEPLFRCNLACAGCGKIQHPTEVLRQRIRDRAERMVHDGLLDELARLRAGGPLSRTAAQAIGYAEAAAVLDGDAPAEELAERIERRTWRYARRQRSWFRADPRAVQVAHPEDAVARLAVR